MITLKDAIYLEKIDEVKRILEENPPLIDEVDEDGVLMALLAAKTGNLNLVRYIVEYSRASMNITDKNQKNMLHYAAMSGNVATCKYLVERVGLSPLSGDINLLTPYEIAHENKFFDLEEYLQVETVRQVHPQLFQRSQQVKLSQPISMNIWDIIMKSQQMLRFQNLS